MTDFEGLLRRLHGAGVEFVLVGGVAAVAHGAARLTLDIDVVYSRRPDTFDRLVAALAPLHPYLRGAPPGLPFAWDRATLERGLNFTLTTDLGDIDLFGEIAGGGGFEDLNEQSLTLTLFGMPIRCLGLEALIRTKRAAGRPKDLEGIAELEALLEERERGV
jgi:predicted nucleotidyltransferase